MHRAAKTKRSREDCSRPLLGVHCNEPSCATSRCLKLPELARWDGATECVQLQRLRHALPISIGMRHIFPARATRRSCPTPELANAGKMWRTQIDGQGLTEAELNTICVNTRDLHSNFTVLDSAQDRSSQAAPPSHPAGAGVISIAHGRTQ